MRRPWALLTSTALAIAALAATLPAAAPARLASDDVSVQVFLRAGNTQTTTTGLNFQIVVEIESTSGVEQPITIRTGLPDGLRWGSDGPDPGEGCTGTAPAICTTKMQPNEVGTIGAGYVWDVVADRPGVYEITASVDPTEPDPDLSNNMDTFRFEVVLPTSGGGSGGGGGGGSGSGAVATAGAVKLTPAKPRAGSLVSATVRVSAGGAPVKPTNIACTGTIGSAKLKGSPKAASGSATCVYRTPKAAKGKTLRGAVSFAARGTKFAKRFSAKLG